MSCTKDSPADGLNNDRRKKITYLITRSDIGGAQFHTLALIQEFHKDYDVLLISGSSGTLSQEVTKLNVRVKVIPEINSFNVSFAVFKLTIILLKEKPDLVHVHSSLASFYGRIASKLAKLNVVYTVHGWHFSYEPSFIKKKIKIAVEYSLKRLTDYWITVSEFDNRLGSRYGLYRDGRVQTVPNGVKASSRKVYRQGNDSLSVVFVGRASYQKNCESAIKVLENTREDVHLTMYASGENLNSLKKLIANSSAKNKINLLMNESDAAENIHKHSVMLMTSRYEGMPLSVLEAMREGLVIVSTDVCGMNELVSNEVNGFLLPEHNEKKIAEALDYLALNLNELQTMGECSRKIFNEKFTLINMLNANRKIYEKII